MKATVQIIYTFESEPQDTGSAFVTSEQFDNKKEFFKAVTESLTEEEKQTLVKLSCCVAGISIPNPNHWYLECNGKFWDDEIPELIKEVYGIESVITPIN